MDKILLTLAATSIFYFSCSVQSDDSAIGRTTVQYELNDYTELKSEMQQKLSNWENEMQSSMAEMKAGETKQLENLNVSSLNTDQKQKVEIAKKAFTELEQKRTSLNDLYTVVMNLYAVDEARYVAFTERMKSYSLDEKQLSDSLVYYYSHLQNYESDIYTMKSVLSELETSSEGNRKTLEEIGKP